MSARARDYRQGSRIWRFSVFVNELNPTCQLSEFKTSNSSSLSHYRRHCFLLTIAAMIHQFEEWSANLAEQSSMENLKDSVVGIEATEYLNRLSKMGWPELNRTPQEALLPALGGVPFGLKHIIKHHISVWRKYGITPIFVFNGLDIGNGNPSSNASEERVRVAESAWTQYASGNAASTVQIFGDSNLVTAKDLYRFLQTILQEQDVEFMVAPYCAWAQVGVARKAAVLHKTNKHSSHIFKSRALLTQSLALPKSSSSTYPRSSQNGTSWRTRSSGYDDGLACNRSTTSHPTFSSTHAC
jgi:hypothetical protein